MTNNTEASANQNELSNHPNSTNTKPQLLNIASINIQRGINSTAKEKECLDIISEYNLDILFLNETDIDRTYMEEKYELSGFKTHLPNSKDKEKVRNVALVRDTIEVISKENF